MAPPGLNEQGRGLDVASRRPPFHIFEELLGQITGGGLCYGFLPGDPGGLPGRFLGVSYPGGLPHARHEADTARAALLDGDAAGTAAVAHFACHARAIPADPLSSYLALAPDLGLARPRPAPDPARGAVRVPDRSARQRGAVLDGGQRATPAELGSVFLRGRMRGPARSSACRY